MSHGNEIDRTPETPASRTDVTSIIRETQRALTQLETANRSQSQMPLRLVGWSAILIASIIIIQGLAALFDFAETGHHLRMPELGIINGALILICGLAMLPERNQNSTPAKIAMICACLIATLTAIAINGALAALFLSSMFVMIHIMLTPYRALWLASATILLVIPITGYFLDHEGQRLVIRFIIGALVTLVVMQILVRYISKTNRTIMAVTGKLSKLALQLDKELIQSNEARDTASMTDPVTGLLNGFGFENAVTRILSEQPYSARRFLLAINFQRLEEFNAILSANEKTFILECLVSRIRDATGEDALIGRTDRDEFCVLLPYRPESESQTMQAISTIHDLLRRPLISTGNTILPTPAIGISVWPEDSEDASSLMGRAAIALQRAYDGKLNTPVRYLKHMRDEHIDQKTLTSDIARAIDAGEFEMHYQPIIDLQNGLLIKAEALIRWNHPTRGFLSPARFVPLAESSGQIIPITHWILENVLNQLHLWRERLAPEFQISINMPSAYLEYCIDNEEKMLSRFLSMHIPPRSLIIEITEGSMLQMTPELMRMLSILESIGFQLAMDDFGVGYSNLSQLERLPLNFLKIDKTFVDGIENSMQKLAICRAIIRIGHELGIKVVAEGIESPEQQQLLRKAGCDFGQGYLFAKPMSAGDFGTYAMDYRPEKITA